MPWPRRSPAALSTRAAYPVCRHDRDRLRRHHRQVDRASGRLAPREAGRGALQLPLYIKCTLARQGNVHLIIRGVQQAMVSAQRLLTRDSPSGRQDLNLRPLDPQSTARVARSERACQRFALLTCDDSSQCNPLFTVVAQPRVPPMCPRKSTVDRTSTSKEPQ